MPACVLLFSAAVAVGKPTISIPAICQPHRVIRASAAKNTRSAVTLLLTRQTTLILATLEY